VQQYGIHPASQLTIIAHKLWADVEIVNVVAIGLFRPCSWFLCRSGNSERTFVSGSWLRNWLMMNVILSTICSDVLSKELGVPFIARWPGRIAAGRIDESSLISAVNLLTTFCEVDGAELPGNYKLVGIRQVSRLTDSVNCSCPLRIGVSVIA
jgi:hypothetical protein